ncbi:hypothetical protein EUGRSUZ_E00420 [Eucalyptus grandis]|uniref:Uncharacterized protein n=2 Tax=Eucalyptus grandis TaxID=71139 RepID=A0ACC3KSJ5_EUCGR|nr:hypothetical protein EUGRSUZ_E00420 [Eucalyptus grandis]
MLTTTEQRAQTEIRVRPVERLHPLDVVDPQVHLPRPRVHPRVHHRLPDRAVAQPQDVADLVRRHRLQIDRHLRLLPLEVQRPRLRRVEVDPPVLRRERVRQHPQYPVERLPVPVVPPVEPDPDVRLPVLHRLDEAHRDHRRPPRERAPEHRPHVLLAQVPDRVLRRERVAERRGLRPVPPRPPGEVRVAPQRLRAVDGGVPDAAPGRHDGRYGLGVELAGDVEPEVGLERDDGGLEVVIEHVREVGDGGGEVPEPAEVPLELRHAVHLAPLPGVLEPREVPPRGIPGVDGYYGYGARRGPGGKARRPNEEEEEGRPEEPPPCRHSFTTMSGPLP